MSDLDSQFDGLSIKEPKSKSLLSSSLASERAKGSFYLEENQAENNFTDEHPEPELLASSVGKEMDGRMIPSSSTISLLSLSVQPDAPKVTTGFHLPQAQHQPLHQVPQQHISNTNLHSYGFNASDRKNSYNNISSRQSLTQLYQKRLPGQVQQTGPPMAPQQQTGPISINSPSKGPNQQLHQYQQQQQQQQQQQPTVYGATTQSIPINNRIPASIPDSPNLDPTSLGGSPSRFWLSSQTPPRSLGNSLNSSSRQLYYMSQHVNHQPLNIQERPNYIAATAATGPIAINRKRPGDSSPVLIPVQTPTEDPPMTPLYLNSQQQGYFEVREDQDEQME